MELLNIGARCVMSDSELFRHIGLAMERNLPEVSQHFAHDAVAVLVGSGPSLEIDSIRKQRAEGHPIIAVKDAHDWLIDRGIVPDYAVAIDPQEHRAKCFKTPHHRVKYMIASQCHPAMFDHLKGFDVYLWHAYVKQGQTVPQYRMLIAGGTTTGLRAITLFYVLGFRRFELYGYDSCLKDGVLRVNGDRSSEALVVPVTVGGREFLCNPAMAAQAAEFERVYDSMPDAQIQAHGEGLIAQILSERNKIKPLTVSFIHKGGPVMASYRYRAEVPASQLANTTLNNPDADVLIFAKPALEEVIEATRARMQGKRVIVDFCDDHFTEDHYKAMAFLADAVTCPTESMAGVIKEHTGLDAQVIIDPYTFDEAEPHCRGSRVLWFGHAVNIHSLRRVQPDLGPVVVVSNVAGSIPWSLETMQRELRLADIVIIPATAEYKSANRAVEAIRQGCFVVAEPHPSIKDFPGIWIGNIKEGIQWAQQNLQEANFRTSAAQSYVMERYSPKTQAFAWRTIIVGQNCISAPERSTGTDG
jgi:uncharacterized Rossmann fold enzyme